MAKIAIALVFQDFFGYEDAFLRRHLMLKRISASSGGWGLPGIEVTDKVERKGIVEVSLKSAIEAEMKNLVLEGTPILVDELEHEGKQVLVYHARFVGHPERDFSNPSESAMFADLSPYKLTSLANKVIKRLPPKPKKRPRRRNQIRVTAF